MKLLIIIPAYNEAESLRGVIECLRSTCPQYDYIIVNDGSTDETKELCEKNGYNVINHTVNKGLAEAMRTGMKYAIENGYDAALQFDADGQHLSEYINSMVNCMKESGCDIVIGSRYVPGGVTNDKLSSQIMSHILNSVMRSILGLKTKDISGGYRLYDAKQLKAIKIASENFEMQQEILARMKANNRNIKIGETPIVFEQRLNGTSTRRLMLYIWCYIKNIFRIIRILH